jgi:hypothetical protein
MDNDNMGAQDARVSTVPHDEVHGHMSLFVTFRNGRLEFRISPLRNNNAMGNGGATVPSGYASYSSPYTSSTNGQQSSQTAHGNIDTGMAISCDSAQGPVPAADLETSTGYSTRSLSPTTVHLPSSSESGSSPSKSLTKRAGGIPPELPPSVEAAYRKKCIQLRQRMNEVEEANDAARQRLARLHRGIQKLRLERAFLLEQLAKRTSTNVEDSEGSPSPPSTVCVPIPPQHIY